MRYLRRTSSWTCDYELDDKTGQVLSVGCSPVADREPSVVDLMAVAGEESQAPADEEHVA